MRLKPSSSDRGHQLSGTALARFGQRRFDEAVRILKEVIPLQPALARRLACTIERWISGMPSTHAAAKSSGDERAFHTVSLGDPLSIQLKAESGTICTLSLSFNNDGPLGTFFRYICDNGTYIARYDDLVNGKDEKIDVSKVDVSMNSKVDVSMNGIELQDREFVAAIRERREPNASVHQVLPCYRVLHRLEGQLTRT